MRAAITQIGFNTLTNDSVSQPYMNVTHFSLAYVNGEERRRGLDVRHLIDMTNIVPADGSGEAIYNVWQKPFFNTDYAGVGGVMGSSLAGYYRYEYDPATDSNQLVVSPTAIVFSGLNPDFDALCGGYITEITIPGITGTENSSTEFSALSTFRGIILPPFNYKVAVASGYMAYGDGNGPYQAEVFFASSLMSDFLINNVYYATTPSLFPIQSWYPVKGGSGTSVDAYDTLKIMNYEISLPGYVPSNGNNVNEMLENAIGNFRFNRIGVYVTKMAGAQAPGTIKDFFPDQSGNEDPILFAVIEIDQEIEGGIAKGNSILMTRTSEGGGSNGYNLTWQADLEFATSPTFIKSSKFYQESYRSQATTQFMRQLEGNVVLAEAYLQLQMQVLELMFTSRAGTNIALSDFTGNANPNPEGEPNGYGDPSGRGSLVSTLYGPWTDDEGASWLSVFGRYKNGNSYPSGWKSALLVPPSFTNTNRNLSANYRPDPMQYDTQTLGALVNQIVDVLVNMKLCSR